MSQEGQEIKAMLNTVLKELRIIREVLLDAYVIPSEATLDMKDDLFGEDPVFEEPDTEIIQPHMPGVTRRLAEYRALDGSTKTVPLPDLLPRVRDVLEASLAANEIFFLYEMQNGAIAISAEDRIINSVNRGAIPAVANEPDPGDEENEVQAES